MEKRLLLGYHTHSGDEVFGLIKRKMVLVFRNLEIRTIAGLAPPTESEFLYVIFWRMNILTP